MAKKHLAAVSLLIVLIFGLTSCVCRSSDTAISMPVYDKPASATANTRTMQDETATKSSSEKSSEATTESAQSEDASALIFPNPCSEQFDLSERDAVLFDAAVAARNRTPNADICIPEIGVYGTYEEAEKTVIVCHVCYHFYYGCDGTEHYTDSGAMQHIRNTHSTIAICLRRCITAAVFSWSLANISITAKQLSVVFVSYRVLL